MEKYYVVMWSVEDSDNCEYESGIINNKLYIDKDEARKVMLEEFDYKKSEYDNTDDLDESHAIDSAFLQVNNECFMNWWVEEVSK